MARYGRKYTPAGVPFREDRPVFPQVFPGERPNYRAFFITLRRIMLKKL